MFRRRRALLGVPTIASIIGLFVDEKGGVAEHPALPANPGQALRRSG
jgi:hypothetical protein